MEPGLLGNLGLGSSQLLILAWNLGLESKRELSWTTNRPIH